MARKNEEPKTLNLGQLADALYAKNAEITEANAVVTALKKEADELEAKIIAAMDAAGTDAARGKSASVSLNPKMRPQIADYDALCAFILKRKVPHLFERRISSTAYAELKESAGIAAVPGVFEYEYRSLNVRKVSSKE